MTGRGVGLALVAGLLLGGCAEDGSVPIYVGDRLVTTVGAAAGGAAPVSGVEAEGGQPQRLGLGDIFSSEGLPVYVGGRRLNCPDDQPVC